MTAKKTEWGFDLSGFISVPSVLRKEPKISWI